MRKSIYILALASLCGCPSSGGVGGGGDAGNRDLTISFGPLGDMSAPPDESQTETVDLASAGDLAGGFCAGTTVAGTCAQGYFAAVARCFDNTGACTTNMPSQTESDTCFQSGARFVATFDMVAMTAVGTWTANHGATKCMSAVVTGMNAPIFHFATSQGSLTYELMTGNVTCPDGSKTNIGADYGACEALKTLVEVPMAGCTRGACP